LSLGRRVPRGRVDWRLFIGIPIFWGTNSTYRARSPRQVGIPCRASRPHAPPSPSSIPHGREPGRRPVDPRLLRPKASGPGFCGRRPHRGVWGVVPPQRTGGRESERSSLNRNKWSPSPGGRARGTTRSGPGGVGRFRFYSKAYPQGGLHAADGAINP
jgi:hypothetical protein